DERHDAGRRGLSRIARGLHRLAAHALGGHVEPDDGSVAVSERLEIDDGKAVAALGDGRSPVGVSRHRRGSAGRRRGPRDGAVRSSRRAPGRARARRTARAGPDGESRYLKAEIGDEGFALRARNAPRVSDSAHAGIALRKVHLEDEGPELVAADVVARREEAARRVQQRDVRLHAGLDRVARLLNEALEAESVLPLRREMRVVGGDERQGRRESEHEPRDERADRADLAAIRSDVPGTHLPASYQRTYRKGDVWGAGVAMMPEIPTLVVDDEPSI